MLRPQAAMPSPPPSPQSAADKLPTPLAIAVADLSRQMSAHSLHQRKPDVIFAWDSFPARLPTPPNEPSEEAAAVNAYDAELSPTTTSTDISSIARDTDQSSSPSWSISPSWSPNLSSVLDDGDAAWGYTPRHTHSNPSHLRRQRQEAVRRQCSATHLREISALVARMVDNGEQCCCTPASAALTDSAICEEPACVAGGGEDDEEQVDDRNGYGANMDVDADRPSAASARPSLAHRQSSGVSKLERLGLGIGGARRRQVTAATRRRNERP